MTLTDSEGRRLSQEGGGQMLRAILIVGFGVVSSACLFSA